MDLSLSPQEEAEITEMFFFESQERHQRLNELLTALETDPDSKTCIDEILRITHTLKGNAMGMNQAGIADLSHVLEDVFETYQADQLKLSKELFAHLYTLMDKLGQLIANIKENKKISHRGIKTKLEVVLRDAKEESQDTIPDNPVEAETENNLEQTNITHEIESKNTPEPIEENKSQIEAGALQSEAIGDHEEAGELKPSFFQNLINTCRSLFANNDLQPVVEEHDGPIVGSEQIEYEYLEKSHENLNQPDLDQTASNIDDRPAMTSNDEKSVLEVLNSESGYVVEEVLEENFNDKVAIPDVVQVPIRKLDALMNQVGQLIIERDRLIASDELNRSRKAEFASLQRITSDLQYSVMDVRLVQVGTLFSKFHRIARDVAHIENKEIDLVLNGNDVEIDRNILKIISDSMVHLVRNAVSHGIESDKERSRLGKSTTGTITMSARNEKDTVILEVSDDGQGIDADQIRNKLEKKGILSRELINQLSDDEVIMHIFETGFSNAETVSEVSGRGVGMDVVKKSTESIGGQVEVTTEVGKGTTISLKLPSSMAVKGVLMFMIGDQEFAIALPYTEAVLSLSKKQIRKAGAGLMAAYLKQTISIVFFKDLLRVNDFSEIFNQDVLHKSFDACSDDTEFEVIVVTYANRFYGLIVDKLLQQKDIIEKPMPKPLDDSKLLSGTTIMGNGNVCMIVDAVSITDILFTSKFKIQEHLKAS